MSKLELKNVSKRFANIDAVHDLNFSAEDKEFLVLIGPSGCGKSTTLNLIAGLEDLSSGEILIAGKRVNDLPPKERDIAMVFQNYALYPHMNVYKNMAFGLKMRGYHKPDIDRQIRYAADILGIGELLNRKPRELSGGQRQRVAVGRAIVRDPAIFLFDEPLSNLDAKLRVQMRSEITHLHQKLETTIVYVTHDQLEAMTMATRIVLLKDGICQQIGPPMELYNRPANRFVAEFIGTPPMNIIPARIVNRDSGFAMVTEAFSLPIPESLNQRCAALSGQEILFGIRPEDIRDTQHSTRRSESSTHQVAMTVDLVETLGSHSLVTLKNGCDKLVATADPQVRARPGEKLAVEFKLSKMNIFANEPPFGNITTDKV